MSDAFEIVWAPAAIADLDDIVVYIAARECSERAATVCLGIQDRVETLSSQAYRGRVVPELKDVGIQSFRETLVAPYRIFFRIEGNAVWVVAVIDGRRDVGALLVSRALQKK